MASIAELTLECIEACRRAWTPAPEVATRSEREGVDRVTHWIEAVERWNRKLDLTAARDRRELVDLMVADATLLADRVPRAATVVDVGSGAGAPGLPLAVLRADLGVTLVEPSGKRAAFLRTVLGELALAQGSEAAAPTGMCATVAQARGEQLVGTRFDVAVARATASPARWLELGSCLAPQGQVWVLLAREQEPQLDGWEPTEDVTYTWPLTGAERRAVAYRALGTP